MMASLIDQLYISLCVCSGSAGEDIIEKPNCRVEREKVISSIDPQYLDTIFIPKCTGESDKFYIEIQCHQKPTRKYCWCVHPITGEPTGSSLVETIDDCKKLSTKKKPQKFGSIKGCLPEKELLFYRKLFGLLTKEMREKSPLLPNGPKRRKPQVAKWKFAMLDSNGNNEVERSEWKEFRATLRDLKNVRKCGRNFIRFCDINKDGRINRREWMKCTVHAYRHAKSTKPNPFLTMLKSID
uniref:Thyroglobulin type-1 domain-containing protein n=1 Tax=Panagrolaimus sp. ES5 TaxID=591445 RepID=A0AC34GXF2_9BILA